MCEMPDVFDCKLVKARKQHRCCECLDDILPGQEHYYSSGLWDGEWQNFRQCAECHELVRSIMSDLPYGEGVPFGELAEFMDPQDSPQDAAWIQRHRRNYHRLRAEKDQKKLCLRW